MKSLIVIVMILTFSQQSFANFLSYKTTTNIKQVYKDKKMAAMMNKYKPKDASTASTSMTYEHNGKMMIYENSQPQTLFDLGNNKMITFFPQKKQYTVMTVDKLVKSIEKMNNNADMKISSNYKKVNVVCTPGNHGNAIHKREGGNRVIVETYDSYANMVYYALSASFRDTKNVEFKVPKTHYAFHDSIGGRMMITHGDVQFSRALGNPGTSLNVKSLSDAITRFNAGEVAAGRKPVDLIMFGHVHFYSDFYTPCGVRVVTNPSLSGTDGFAHSLGINNSTSAQVLFESTKDYILGDSRLVQLNEADDMKSLDKIIPTFNKELKWN